MSDELKAYCKIDLSVLIILAIITQLSGYILNLKFPEANFYINFSILIGLLAIVRWGYLGVIVYVVAGLSMLFISDTSYLETILVYPFANAFIILALVFFKLFDVSKLKENNLVLILFILTIFVSVSIGKGIASFILGNQLISSILYYFTVNLFNVVMVYVVLQIIKNKEGLLIKFL